MIVATAIAAILSGVALVHAYWGAGGFWPAQDARALEHTVIGTDFGRMPSAGLTYVVAVLILTAGLIPLARIGVLPLPLPEWMLQLACAGLALIFAVRGILGYSSLMGPARTKSPFTELNRRYFSPLCIALGIGFAALAL